MSFECTLCDKIAENWGRLVDHFKAVHPEVTFKCPRQAESPMFPYPEHVSFWRKNETCSHCGSVSPKVLFEAIEAGKEIGPTDKNYKVYLEGMGEGRIKFYFQHFNQEERDKFISLVNEKKINFGYPHHLYVLPFFCRRKES